MNDAIIQPFIYMYSILYTVYIYIYTIVYTYMVCQYLYIHLYIYTYIAYLHIYIYIYVHSIIILQHFWMVCNYYIQLESCIICATRPPLSTGKCAETVPRSESSRSHFMPRKNFRLFNTVGGFLQWGTPKWLVSNGETLLKYGWFGVLSPF